MSEPNITGEQRGVLVEKLTALADDELLLAHRNSEWIGHAPILEEDIALANLSQDELGHAQLWLELRRLCDGSDPDQLVFHRGPAEFRSAALLELPRGDWAFTLLRQFLFDAYELAWLSAALSSSWRPLAETAGKIVREERFHLQHSGLWVRRLGLGTAESARRTQAALDELWPHAQQLFVPLDGERALMDAGVLPHLSSVEEGWREHVTRHLEESGLQLPALASTTPLQRWQHSEHLPPLLAELQSVARADSEAGAW